MFQSPTYGTISTEKLKKTISTYMEQDKIGEYNIIVGTDSEKADGNSFDFVSAIIIHHVGYGGIYFWKRNLVKKKMSLKERIYQEAIMSLETSENLFELILENYLNRNVILSFMKTTATGA